MKNIFFISKLLVKKKLQVLTDEENTQLEECSKQYSFLKNIDDENINKKISEYSKVDKDKAWEHIVAKASKEKSQKTIPLYKRPWVKYAATILLFLGLGYFSKQTFFRKESALVIPSESIRLQLEDGTIMIIDENSSSEVVDENENKLIAQKGKMLVYFNKQKKENLLYNTLTVPYGKRFEIQLSDGTKVHLNAGSSLKYPIAFLQGQERKVFLDGEAFFEVAKDAKHPFVVNAKDVAIRVLGTQFNVSSYPEDDSINTVLVEGSVSVYHANKTYNKETAMMLVPGQKATWDKKQKNIEIDVADVVLYTAWRDGRLLLNEVSFNDILKKIERQYNVVFENHCEEISNRKFTAKFDVENIHQVMESLSYSVNFTYKFQENKIIINNPKNN
ncbi:FecR domain-containing protein [Wenyingzhuangia sp. 1_MG-2023]|nr:FecR domain-containing protein [Wenyingzhuangia sp. 1_MG-2023]